MGSSSEAVSQPMTNKFRGLPEQSGQSLGRFPARPLLKNLVRWDSSGDLDLMNVDAKPASGPRTARTAQIAKLRRQQFVLVTSHCPTTPSHWFVP
jgi:hypothetical protein